MQVIALVAGNGMFSSDYAPRNANAVHRHERLDKAFTSNVKWIQVKPSVTQIAIARTGPACCAPCWLLLQTQDAAAGSYLFGDSVL